MANSDFQPHCIAELLLKLLLPETMAIAIAPSTIRQDEQLSCTGIELLAFLFPPGADGIYRKLCGVRRIAHPHKALIGGDVIDTVRNSSSKSILSKVMDHDSFRFFAPRSSCILE